MALPWFKLWEEFGTDPKVQILSEVDQRRFIMLLCLCCRNGYVTLHDTEVACYMRVTCNEWLESKSNFLRQNLINDQNQPCAWEKRQSRLNSSAARVKAWRERQKLAKNSNVTVTLRNTPCNAQEEELELDKDNNKKIHKKRNSNITKFLDPDIETAFQEFYKLYPKHEAKKPAQKIFHSLCENNGELKTKIIAGLQIQLPKLKQTDIKFVALPSTWLHQERWTDEPPPKRGVIF